MTQSVSLKYRYLFWHDTYFICFWCLIFLRFFLSFCALLWLVIQTDNDDHHDNDTYAKLYNMALSSLNHLGFHRIKMARNNGKMNVATWWIVAAVIWADEIAMPFQWCSLRIFPIREFTYSIWILIIISETFARALKTWITYEIIHISFGCESPSLCARFLYSIFLIQ